jgi:hypothetical protein
MLYRLGTLFLSFWYFCVSSFLSYSCPCGCGSSLPLVTDYENQVKIKFSLSHKFSRRYISLYGANYQSPARVPNISLLNMAFAYGFIPDWSLSATVVGQLNQNGDNQDYAFGDPSLSINWAFNQHHSRGNFPEVYFSLGLKSPLAQYDFDALKSHSNGFWELSPRASLFQHFGSWELGFSDSLIWKFSGKKILSTVSPITPGLINQAQVSAGYIWYGFAQLQSSLKYEYRFSDRNQAKVLPLTSSQSFLSKLVLNLRVGDKKTLSFFYDKPVLLSYSYHSELDDSLGVSYTHSL